MQPQVLQDPAGVHYYIDPTTNQRYDAVNGAWQPSTSTTHLPAAVPEPVAPAPVAVPQPVAVAPVAAVPVAQPPAAMQAIQQAGAQQPAGVGPNLQAFDMSNVNDDAFRLIPDQAFANFEIIDVEAVKTNTDGTDMLKLTFEVYDGEFKGCKVWDQIKLSESSMWKFKRLCRVTNLLDPSGTRFTGQSFLAFKGKRVRFQVKVETYGPENKKKNSVDGSYEFIETAGAAPAGQMGFVTAAAPVVAAPAVAPTWPAAPQG